MSFKSYANSSYKMLSNCKHLQYQYDIFSPKKYHVLPPSLSLIYSILSLPPPAFLINSPPLLTLCTTYFSVPLPPFSRLLLLSQTTCQISESNGGQAGDIQLKAQCIIISQLSPLRPSPKPFRLYNGSVTAEPACARAQRTR